MYGCNASMDQICSSFSLHSEMTPDRRIGRGAMIPRGLLGDEMERGAIDCRSPKTKTATFLEADNDTFLAPNLFSPAAPRGDH